jgi:hypothetical protein
VEYKEPSITYRECGSVKITHNIPISLSDPCTIIKMKVYFKVNKPETFPPQICMLFLDKSMIYFSVSKIPKDFTIIVI